MRALQWLGLAILITCLGASGVSADDGQKGDAAAKVAEAALSALKTRMDARIKEGELLAKSGRLEEALDAYRSVGDLYTKGMAEVRRLVAALGTAPRGNVADEPFSRPRVDPRGAGTGAGGAFHLRKGMRPRSGNSDAHAAVERSLAWLAAHQSPNGSWGAADFATWCDGKPILDASKRADGLGKSVNDVGVTGVALCAFLGAGYTNRGKHPYAQVVKKGLRYLKNVQDPEGCFGPRTTQQYIYNHATASLAMIEAYGMTNSPIFKTSAQRALDFIALSRNPYMAWRYGVKPGDNDTSVTAWMVMCLKSATLINRAALKGGKSAPLTVDEAGFKGARVWLEKVTDPDSGRVGYNQRGTGPARAQDVVDRFPSHKSEAMTAAGIFMRVLMGEDPRKSQVIQKGADLCVKLPPVWNVKDGSIDMIYWYYGTLALYQVGGKHWSRWIMNLDAAVVETQRQDGDICGMKGSWDPVGPWGAYGGRVYATALLTLTLESYMRYKRVFGPK